MTLKELIKQKREEAKFWTKSDDFNLDPEKLEQMLPLLKQCDEFKDCDLKIMKFPTGNKFPGEEKSIFAYSRILHEGSKFGKKCYLYMICLSPTIYEKSDIIHSGKDGNCITPLMYDPETFTHQRKVILSINPTIPPKGLNTDRQKIHDLLDEVLDNPDKYKPKGTQGVILRGYFEVYSGSNEGKPVKI